MDMAKKNLTPKQARFVEEYLVDLNASAAARRAGYSESTANRIGPENLSKPVIKSRIDAALDQRSSRTEVTADKVVRELARIAFADVREVAEVRDGSVRVKDTDEWSDDAALAVSEVKETKRGRSVKMHSKLDALKKLGEHLGLWRDDRELRVSVLHWIASLPADRLRTLQHADDDEVKKMLSEFQPAGALPPGPNGRRNGS